MGDTKTHKHLLYASGNFGKSSLASLIEIYALFYLTDVMGIQAGVAGVILLISLVWDAITDPLIGWFIDRMKQRFRTVKLYFLIGAPITVLSFISLFHMQSLEVGVKPIYVVFMLLLYRSAYTIVDVPHNSLLFFMSKNGNDRTNIASMRIFFSSLGKFLVTLMAIYVFGNGGEKTLVNEFALASIVLAIIYLISISLCLFAVRNVPIHNDSTKTKTLSIPLFAKAIFKNPYLFLVFCLTAINSLSIPVIGTALIYYGKYGIGNETYGAQAVTLLAVSQAFSLFLWARYANQSKQNKYVSIKPAYIILFLSCLLALFCMNSVTTMFIFAMCSGFAIGGIFMLNWSMLPDAIEYMNTDTTGYEVGIFGVYTFSNKLFHGLSQAYVGIVLTLIGYESNAEETVNVIGLFRYAVLSLPTIGALCCIILLSRYAKNT